MFGVRDRFDEQGAHMIIVERVDHAASVTFADDQSEMPQHPQLLRYR